MGTICLEHDVGKLGATGFPKDHAQTKSWRLVRFNLTGSRLWETGVKHVQSRHATVIGAYSENRLLSSLPAADLELLRGNLRGTVLSCQSLIYEPGEPVTKVYFPYTGAISLVVVFRSGHMIETAMIGKDGMLGAMSILDGQPEVSKALVQIEGAAWVCDVEPLRKLAKQREAIQSMLLQDARALSDQMQRMAACNAAHSLEERFCRWLLRAVDASGKKTICTTQESIAEMLGVKRTSLSLIAHGMQQAGLIRNRRGQIEIVNMDALRDKACECYVDAASSQRRLHTGEPGFNAASTTPNSYRA